MCRTQLHQTLTLQKTSCKWLFLKKCLLCYVLTKSNKLLKTIGLEKHEELLVNTNNLFGRQITLREQMDLTIAVTDGIIACREKMLNNDSSLKERFEKQYFKQYDGKFYHGFHKGYKEEKERLQKMNLILNCKNKVFI